MYAQGETLTPNLFSSIDLNQKVNSCSGNQRFQEALKGFLEVTSPSTYFPI
jgi:hypothetical protein